MEFRCKYCNIKYGFAGMAAPNICQNCFEMGEREKQERNALDDARTKKSNQIKLIILIIIGLAFTATIAGICFG